MAEIVPGHPASGGSVYLSKIIGSRHLISGSPEIRLKMLKSAIADLSVAAR